MGQPGLRARESFPQPGIVKSAAMRQGLKDCGLIHAIVTWKGQIVDGRHREQFCRELEVERRYDDISNKTEDQMRHYVAGLNQHRRARTTPITNEEKRARVEAELKADPNRSDSAIAKAVGVMQNFVGRTRARLESGGVISEITPTERASRTGKIGEGQRSNYVEGQSRRHAEKRARAEAALRADPNRSNRTIGDAAQVSADLVTDVRMAIFGKSTPDFIAEKRTGNRNGVTVPSGKKLSELYRDGMALEAAGEIAKDLTKKLGVGFARGLSRRGGVQDASGRRPVPNSLKPQTRTGGATARRRGGCPRSGP